MWAWGEAEVARREPDSWVLLQSLRQFDAGRARMVDVIWRFSWPALLKFSGEYWLPALASISSIIALVCWHPEPQLGLVVAVCTMVVLGGLGTLLVVVNRRSLGFSWLLRTAPYRRMFYRPKKREGRGR